MLPLRQPTDLEFREVSGVEGDEATSLLRGVVELSLVGHGFPPHLPEAHDVKPAQAQRSGCGDVDVGVQRQSQHLSLVQGQPLCL